VKSPCYSNSMQRLLVLVFPVLFHFSVPIHGLSQHVQHDKNKSDQQGSLLELSRRQFSISLLGGSSASLLSAVGNNNGQQLLPRAISGRVAPVNAAAMPSSPLGPYLTKEYYDVNAMETAPEAGRFYFPTILPPLANRATYRYTLGRNAWAFEQLLTFQNVTATIRCNVIQLQDDGGGLWVHSPLYPTGEFCKLLDDLGHPVQHVVLPCNALEHKAPVQAFLQRYPDASVWISPGQYGPFGVCGRSMTANTARDMGHQRVDGILGDTSAPPPSWAKEFDICTLYADIPQNAGPLSEVAFCHRPTKTLIATDAVVFIPGDKTATPEIFSTYFDPAVIREDETFWPRTVLQSVFLPLRSVIDENTGKVFYPGFDAIKDRLIRAPILRAFADARAPKLVDEWVSTIGTWNFDRILTSHFASPIAAGPLDFVAAYSYLPQSCQDAGAALSSKRIPPIVPQDWELLDGLNQVIADNKLGAPAVYDYQQECR
jgi:Domain of unknown function (DUF4336)